jgi:hypothetical protein
MTREVTFKYFLDGEQVHKSEIDWDSDITIKSVDDIVYVTTNTQGYLSTRHKHPPGRHNKKD